jgi:hypothetical protein
VVLTTQLGLKAIAAAHDFGDRPRPLDLAVDVSRLAAVGDVANASGGDEFADQRAGLRRLAAVVDPASLVVPGRAEARPGCAQVAAGGVSPGAEIGSSAKGEGRPLDCRGSL